MKRALLVGIDHYDEYRDLEGCVNDVNAILPLLANHENGWPNFDCRPITSGSVRADREPILAGFSHLVSPGADIALFYFAGHGKVAANDVILVAQNTKDADSGVALSVLLGKVQGAKVGQVVIILDCCFAGGAGGVPQLGGEAAVLRSGVSILTASRSDQTAAETPAGRGAFSVYLCGALDNGAADVLGKVTLASVYAYLSESFGPWDQRPTFKANLERLHELRLCAPAVPIEELRRLPEFFTTEDAELPLDPSYEPDTEPRHPEHQETFAILQRCRAAKLVVPVGAEHMYFAAVNSKACRLTPLGRHYWNLAKKRLL